VAHNLSREEIEYFKDSRGTLGVLDFNKLPFLPRRIYWITDTPENVTRGAHAHKLLNQVFLVLSGSVMIDTFKGLEKQSFNLIAEGPVLMLEPGCWRDIKLLTPDSLLLVLCDREYEESDYIREWEDYLEWFKANEP
jgi:dTDP-4-dehydrorhamnose 3,5-epimerase-like enzyme